MAALIRDMVCLRLRVPDSESSGFPTSGVSFPKQAGNDQEQRLGPRNRQQFCLFGMVGS